MSESKELILSCARDIFLKEGLSHFSMRKVASCVGMSATALYRHYTNKEELLFQVLLRGYRIFSRYLEKILQLVKFKYNLWVLETTGNSHKLNGKLPSVLT